jgi:two-component system, cell cycle sensor histidine kinase and response regulator CckA
MKPTPSSPDEQRRLEILREYEVLDTPPEKVFDEITALAAHICEAPIALISLVDEKRQWFKSRVGLTVAETDRAVSFCSHAIQQRDLFVVPDATRDARFAGNPFVTAEPHLRFYAGTPLVAPEGHALGTLCVLDRVPRELRPDQQQALQVLGHHAMTLLELRRRHRELSGLRADRERVAEAERTLRENEQRFRAVFEKATDGILLADPQTEQFCFGNEAICQMLGCDAGELTTLGVVDIHPPEALNRIREMFGRQSRGEVFIARDIPVRRRGGGVFYADISSSSITLDGRPLLVGFFRDVTERRQTDEALRQFRFSMDQASDAIFWMNQEAGFTYVNDEACRSLGYTREEFLGLHLWDIDPVFPRERWAAEWEQYRQAAQIGSQHLESLHRRKDGTVFPVEVMAKHIWFEETELHVAFVRDISERKRTEETQARLAKAVEQAAEAIVITDAAGAISYVNPAFESITGYSREEAVGQNPRLLKSGRHDAAFYRYMWDLLLQGKVWTGRIVNKRKDGKLYEEETTISPVLDPAGKIVNYVAVKRDITQEVALEQQLRQAQKMEAIGLLAGGVAHDFNNILTIIQGNASLLLNTPLQPAEQTDCAQQISRAAERAAGLIRQLLMFSRKQVMQPANVNLNEVVAQTAKMLQRILGEDIALQTNYAPKMAIIWADVGMIEQVLLNLVINSRDAMPEGGRLTISTGTETLDAAQAQQHPDGTPGRYVWLAVSDTGCGIPPENLTRIFEPFFTTKEVGKGTGLGLATVYGIVKQHRGWVQVGSELNQGTTFRIYFPAVMGERAEAKAPAVAAPLPRGTETLLVVEDDLPLRLLVSNLLQRCGYTVLQAESGKAALSLWREHRDRIHLLFTDLVMPDGMTGRQLAEQLRSEKPLLRIIYTSGYSTEVGKGLSLSEGVNFLQKPYPSAKLARTVRDCLDRQ